jgi:hypothetical protein
VSYISDYLSGATDEVEFQQRGIEQNLKERYEEEHKYDDFFIDPDFDDLESLDEEET